jgi:predicted RecA/RadA family phage recombinase
MTPKLVWKRNTRGAKAPLVMLLPYLAGSSNAIEPGDPVVISAGSFIPLAADQAMAGTFAVSDHRITASHLAGHYPTIVPQDGDIFEAELATAAAIARGASVYLTDSTAKLASSGTNVLGNVFDHAGFPLQQGNADVGDVADRGTTVGTVSKVLISIKKAVSYDAALRT